MQQVADGGGAVGSGDGGDLFGRAAIEKIEGTLVIGDDAVAAVVDAVEGVGTQRILSAYFAARPLQVGGDVTGIFVDVDGAAGLPHGHKVLDAADQIGVVLSPENGGVLIGSGLFLMGCDGIIAPVKHGGTAAEQPGAQRTAQQKRQYAFQS